jgi:ADP-ribosylglycohydrolase
VASARHPEPLCDAILGLAAGDALGTALEFELPCTFATSTDMIGGGPFALSPGNIAARLAGTSTLNRPIPKRSTPV